MSRDVKNLVFLANKARTYEDSTTFQFGKHKGQTVVHVYKTDVQYLSWLVSEGFVFKTSFKIPAFVEPKRKPKQSVYRPRTVYRQRTLSQLFDEKGHKHGLW